MYQRKVEYPDCINQKITEKGTVTITSGKVSIPKFLWVIDLFLTFLEHLKLMISAKDCKVESGGFYAFTLEIDCEKNGDCCIDFPLTLSLSLISKKIIAVYENVCSEK